MKHYLVTRETTEVGGPHYLGKEIGGDGFEIWLGYDCSANSRKIAIGDIVVEATGGWAAGHLFIVVCPRCDSPLRPCSTGEPDMHCDSCGRVYPCD